MKFEQKSITEATEAEVRAFAVKFLGIPLEASTPFEEVMAKVRTAHPSDDIWIEPETEVDQAGAPPPAPIVDNDETGPRLVGGLGRNDPRVRLTLHAEEREGVVVSRHKEIGVNGVVWLVKRGESVEVPYRVYLALRDAMRENITHDAEGTPVHQIVHNTPFNVEMMPPQAEIDAWHARTRDVFCPA